MIKDQEYLTRARNGDERAMNDLLTRYKDFAYSIALKMISDTNDAQDIVQNSFIKIFLKIKTFNSESKFETWLFKIVYRESLNYIKRKKIATNLDSEVNLVTNDQHPSFSNDKSKAVKDVMRCLSINEYVVIQLFYLAEKNISEIEHITGLSDPNIKVLLYRSRRKMFDYFSKNLQITLTDLL